MNAFTRRGACPALSAPMQTGDGLLVRLNPVARGLSPKALIGLCKAALRHGNGVIEVTARGSLQIRGLTVPSAPLFATEVDALGIAVRTGVPVETGRLAGLDPEEIADPSPPAERIRSGIEAAGLQDRLGPKVSVVIDGGGRSGMELVSGDVRLTAMRYQTGIFWLVSTSGDAQAATPLGILDEQAACVATISVLEAIASLGSAARARDLPSHDLQRLVSRDGFGSPRRQESAKDGQQNPSMYAAVHLNDGCHALGVALPFGHTDAGPMIEFVQKAEALGVTDIRPAPQRMLILICASDAVADAMQASARKLNFVVDPGDPRTRIAACPGAPACASGHIASRDLAAEIASNYSEFLDGSFELHISGCAKGCAHPGASALTLVGSENGAGIVVGGTAKDIPSAYTPPQDTARALGRVAGLVRNERRSGETAAVTLTRLGSERLAEVFEKQ